MNAPWAVGPRDLEIDPHGPTTWKCPSGKMYAFPGNRRWAVGVAHHWARQLTKMGHQVRLMPAEFVKAFNIRNKNDAADARAIWLAVQQPSKAVAMKTEM